jgi:hypothetical protein
MEDRNMMAVSAYVSKSTYLFLRELSIQTSLPVSKLISFAIDNEMDAKIPFNYPCLEPTNEFIEGAYQAEALKISDYLKNFEGGADIETIMMHRRDIGIPDKNTLMLAVREMLKTGIFEYADPPYRQHYQYPPGHKFLRIIEIDGAQLVRRKKRLVQQMARLESEITKLKGEIG